MSSFGNTVHSIIVAFYMQVCRVVSIQGESTGWANKHSKNISVRAWANIGEDIFVEGKVTVQSDGSMFSRSESQQGQ